MAGVSLDSHTGAIMEFVSYLDGLKDPDTQLSVTGLQQLDALEPEQAEAFRSAWPEIVLERRRQVIHQLVELTEDSIDLNFDAVFFAAMEDGDAAVRRDAVRGLWEYEEHDLIPSLLRLLERDEEAEVRAEAALALGRFVLLSTLGNLREHHYQKVEQGLRRTIENELEVEEVRARALEAVGADPFVGLDDPGVEHLRHDNLAGEQIRAVLVGDAELVAQPAGDDQDGGVALALEERVGGHRGAHLDPVDPVGGDRVGRTQPEEIADCLEGGVRVSLRVVGEQLGGGKPTVRAPRHHIGEGAAPVDPEIPCAVSRARAHTRSRCTAIF